VLGTLGLREAGFLAAAYTVASGLRAVFSQASTQYLIPLTSRSGGSEERAAEVAKYIRTLIVLLLAAVLPLVLFPYELVVALYSRKFAVATDVLGIFILSEAILALGDAYRVLQLGFNDLVGFFITTFSGVAIVSIGAWWVIPQFGLRGIALLQVTSSLLVLVQSIDRVRSKHGLRVERRTLVMTLFAIGALAAAVVIGRAFPAPQPARMAAKGAFAISALLVVWRLLPPDERHGIMHLIRRPG
jgi:O-antigen/teichoic acid export membrane protein